MWFTPDKKSGVPVSRQLYEKIKYFILSGELREREKLPSSRALGKDLNLARSTVLEAYDQLIAEGYLETRQGSGTTVAQGIIAMSHTPAVTAPARLHHDEGHTSKGQNSEIISFRSGIPDLEAFPKKEWAKIYAHVSESLPSSSFRYCEAEGVWGLREAIAAYLFRMRGIRVSPHRVMITSGSTQGLSLVARLLRKKGDVVFVEDPAHTGMAAVVTRAGLRMQGIGVDEQGMDVSALQKFFAAPRPDVAFVYTTPSHQYPLGAILPIQRRQALVRFAREMSCAVVEDDYDSEFRYEGAPTSALYELDPEMVIYLGSFSKILAPALRLGFALIPESMMDDWRREKRYMDVHTDALSQHALAEFIRKGGLERHIWKMKKIYARKRSHLLQCLTKNFGGAATVRGQATGLHLVASFSGIVFTEEVTETLYGKGVKVYPVERYSLRGDGSHAHEIILGYSHLTHEEISRGIEVIKKTLCL
ncbi:MAG: GntR family transcriptional regulator [Desulfovibrio sp. MES5]|uniref:MocR-like pyridoxine biosynthesis transcription factor PdxR n=1 Tax=Desulfovibrio sp. MES5 TaxID=1899016 RepID=UPI000B9CE1ED|nr:PLP-dependent aminotransferase family protein [Desulfovibrio sp. MES5]OXS28532.1 MAG: GntR family transcriptional regulator [Desulfovibrio sp. MES5]